MDSQGMNRSQARFARREEMFFSKVQKEIETVGGLKLEDRILRG
jgi:hypothetical protein